MYVVPVIIVLLLIVIIILMVVGFVVNRRKKGANSAYPNLMYYDNRGGTVTTVDTVLYTRILLLISCNLIGQQEVNK